MLVMDVTDKRFFDEKTEMVFTVKGRLLKLEHSLSSIRNWESKWHKPFLSEEKKTLEEFSDYVYYMDLEPDFRMDVYKNLSNDEIKKIVDYMNDKATASWISKKKNQKQWGKSISSAPITAEILYYNMIELGIPIEMEKWHINQLIMTMQVITEKRKSDNKPMSKAESARWMNAENERRLREYNTKG